MFMGRNREAAQRATERRQHEDGAQRLQQAVPRLLTLKLEVEDGIESTFGGVTHVRHVIVPSAPALFELPCGDRTCKDGGHDLTRELLRELQASKVEFHGKSECNGYLGTDGAQRCTRILRYVARATYGAA
jgi:hypothetical protein